MICEAQRNDNSRGYLRTKFHRHRMRRWHNCWQIYRTMKFYRSTLWCCCCVTAAVLCVCLSNNFWIHSVVGVYFSSFSLSFYSLSDFSLSIVRCLIELARRLMYQDKQCYNIELFALCELTATRTRHLCTHTYNWICGQSKIGSA